MKIISIVSTSDAQIWIEDYDNESELLARYQEIIDSNSDVFETKQFVFLIDGEIKNNNIKNIETIKIKN